MTPSLALRQTAARIVHGKRFGALGRRRRIPLTRSPTLIESDYAGRLVAILDRIKHSVSHVTAGLVLRLDDHPGAKARRNIARVREQVDAELNTTALEGMAESFGKRVAQHQRGELARQSEAALGTDVVLTDAGVSDLIEGFVHENVSRVRRLQGAALDDLETILTTAAATGTRAEAVQEQIEARFGMAERHARLLAHDQVQRLTSRVTEARHRELGITSYVWLHTGAAKKPRPEHVARHGRVFRYDEPPADGHPGIAVMCFPGDTPVWSASPVDKLYRRWYRGRGVVLGIDGGRSLTSTPNHPILTLSGWKAAQDIEVGEYVIEASEEGVDADVSDREYAQPTLHELFNALAPLVVVEPRHCLAGGFHGDLVLDQEVDVVDMNRCLSLEGNLALSQSFCEKLLALADDPGAGRSKLDFLFDRPGPAARRHVRSGSQLLTLLLGEGAHADGLRLRAIARLDALAHELRTDGLARDAEVFRHAIHAPPVGVELRHHVARIVLGMTRRAVNATARLHAPSAENLAQMVAAYTHFGGDFRDGFRLEQCRRVVEKGSRQLNVHVYNLQTRSSWYLARNLVVHNCHCLQQPNFDDIYAELDALGV